MKQFSKILKFELKNYFANKVFVGVTLFLVAVIAIVMFFPRVMGVFDSGEDAASTDRPVMLIGGGDTDTAEAIRQAFSEAFTDYQVTTTDAGVAAIKEQVTDGEAECAFVLDSLTAYTYYVDNLSMFDTNTVVANEVLQALYRTAAMTASGISAEQATDILATPIEATTQSLGKDQMHNFVYTYIMIYALYMVILLYGQMVASNVATEKSSRAMEVLITSAKPVSMMFGKVLASCLAGLIQLVAVFGAAFISFNLNKTYWNENGIVASIFDVPLELLLYMLVFFVLGFLVYAFLFGALGSTVSKMEDINTAVTPVVLPLIFGLLVVVIALSSGTVDSTLMKVCSFVPFTSPVAMFTRIAMSTVPVYEIAISIVLLIATAIGIGVLSAKIYRVGVLLYGTPPKMGAILNAIRKA